MGIRFVLMCFVLSVTSGVFAQTPAPAPAPAPAPTDTNTPAGRKAFCMSKYKLGSSEYKECLAAFDDPDETLKLCADATKEVGDAYKELNKSCTAAGFGTADGCEEKAINCSLTADDENAALDAQINAMLPPNLQSLAWVVQENNNSGNCAKYSDDAYQNKKERFDTDYKDAERDYNKAKEDSQEADQKAREDLADFTDKLNTLQKEYKEQVRTSEKEKRDALAKASSELAKAESDLQRMDSERIGINFQRSQAVAQRNIDMAPLSDYSIQRTCTNKTFYDTDSSGKIIGPKYRAAQSSGQSGLIKQLGQKQKSVSDDYYACVKEERAKRQQIQIKANSAIASLDEQLKNLEVARRNAQSQLALAKQNMAKDQASMAQAEQEAAAAYTKAQQNLIQQMKNTVDAAQQKQQLQAQLAQQAQQKMMEAKQSISKLGTPPDGTTKTAKDALENADNVRKALEKFQSNFGTKCCTSELKTKNSAYCEPLKQPTTSDEDDEDRPTRPSKGSRGVEDP